MGTEKTGTEKTGDLLEKRRKKNRSIAETVHLYPNDFQPRHTTAEILSAVDAGEAGEAGPEFSIAGRMMAVNRFGKSSFIRLRDRRGQLQAYIRKDKVGEEAYALFRQMDIGDFIGLCGVMFQTKTGEWTLLASELRLVSKSVRPLPEKFHGLKDPEKRYRRRYVDLIMNPDVREIFHRRSLTVQAVRDFLVSREFLEVETPMMQPVPGGADAEPFVTRHNALDMDLYLRIAPELYLKRLVVGGFERVFEINRNFRNEGVSTQHNPEFTMVEFYQAYARHEDLMNLTETMFCHVAETVTGNTRLSYQGHDIDFGAAWRRLDLLESLSAIGGLDPSLLNDKDALLAEAEKRGITITKTGQLGKVLTKLFDALVEPELIQPTFITGYPVEVSPLSRRNDASPEFTERFELFIGGREIANGFSELNDPEDQRGRFLRQMENRRGGDAEAHRMDEDYIEALEYGMPPTAGEGIGIDRLVMLLTDAASIREVILFPHMKHRA